MSPCNGMHRVELDSFVQGCREDMSSADFQKRLKARARRTAFVGCRSRCTVLVRAFHPGIKCPIFGLLRSALDQLLQAWLRKSASGFADLGLGTLQGTAVCQGFCCCRPVLLYACINDPYGNLPFATAWHEGTHMPCFCYFHCTVQSILPSRLLTTGQSQLLLLFHQ